MDATVTAAGPELELRRLCELWVRAVLEWGPALVQLRSQEGFLARRSRGDERVLRQVLGELHITSHPGECADEAGRLGPPRGVDGLGRVVRRGLRWHRASVVSPAQASGASGPFET